MAKRDYLKDYVPTGDGGYEYVGTHWGWPSDDARMAFTARARLLFAVAALCLIGAGFVPAPGTFGAFYVVIPFIVGAIGAALAGVSLYRVSTEPNPMRDHIYASNARSLPPKLLAGAFGSLICGVAAALHGAALLAAGDPAAMPVPSLVFAALMLVAGVCLWRIHTAFSGIVFDRV